MDEITLTRIPSGQPEKFTITMPEGRIEVEGTTGFVLDVFKRIMEPGSVLHNILLEHTTPEDIEAAWRAAMIRAGFRVEDL